jgi:hypothetical protein
MEVRIEDLREETHDPIAHWWEKTLKFWWSVDFPGYWL